MKQEAWGQNCRPRVSPKGLCRLRARPSLPPEPAGPAQTPAGLSARAQAPSSPCCPSLPGLGGAIGYVLGGLDWTQTFLGSWFRTQNQVLFFFAAVLFTASVALHLCSIEEEQYCPQQERAEAPPAPPGLLDGGLVPDEVQSEQELALDYLGEELVRSKSDSALHVPDAALGLEPELLFLRGIEPSIFHDASGPGTPTGASQDLSPGPPPRLSPPLGDTTKEDAVLLAHPAHEAQVPNGSGSPPRDGALDPKPSAASGALRRRRHGFRRQASSTFSYYGKIGSHRYRYRRANAVVLIKPSRSMSDLYDLQKRQRQRSRHRNQSGATTSSGDTESEEGEGETTVRLLWLSMLKMPRELLRLCLCHLLTWFSVIAEAVFYTDFMGQVIFDGDPKVSGGCRGPGERACDGPVQPARRRGVRGRPSVGRAIGGTWSAPSSQDPRAGHWEPWARPSAWARPAATALPTCRLAHRPCLLGSSWGGLGTGSGPPSTRPTLGLWSCSVGRWAGTAEAGLPAGGAGTGAERGCREVTAQR